MLLEYSLLNITANVGSYNAEGNFGFDLLAKLSGAVVWVAANAIGIVTMAATHRNGYRILNPFLTFQLLYGLLVAAIMWHFPVVPWQAMAAGWLSLFGHLSAVSFSTRPLQQVKGICHARSYTSEMLPLLLADLLLWLGSICITGCWWLLAALPVFLLMRHMTLRRP